MYHLCSPQIGAPGIPGRKGPIVSFNLLKTKNVDVLDYRYLFCFMIGDLVSKETVCCVGGKVKH